METRMKKKEKNLHYVKASAAVMPPSVLQWLLLIGIIVIVLFCFSKQSKTKLQTRQDTMLWEQIKLNCENSMKDFKVDIIVRRRQSEKHKQKHKHNFDIDIDRVAAADDPTGTVIPYTLCNAANEQPPLLTNIVLQASPYPPIVGQSIVLSISGNLSQPITGGTYSASAKVGFLTVYQTQGSLPSNVLPAPAGPFTLTQTFTVPQIHISPELKFEARDSNNQLITCLTVQLAAPAAPQTPAPQTAAPA